MQNAKQIIAQKVMKTASKHQFRGGFCHVLIKKMHTPKPCSATVCGIVTFLFRPFCEKYTKQSEPPHYQRLVLS